MSQAGPWEAAALHSGEDRAGDFVADEACSEIGIL